MVQEPRIYTRDEVAEILRVSKQSVDAYIASGSLPVVRLGKRVFVSSRVIGAILRGERDVVSVRQKQHSRVAPR